MLLLLLWLSLLLLLFSLLFADPKTRLSSSSACALVFPNNISIKAIRNCLVLTQYMIGLVNELRIIPNVERDAKRNATFLGTTDIFATIRATIKGK